MAEGKKSFILYADQIHLFDGLDDSEAGILIKHIFKYVNDMNPECDKLTKIAFEPIKQQLKRDLIEWNKTSVNRSVSGQLGGFKSGETRRKQKEANEASALKSKQKEANEAVNVNVNEKVNEIISAFNLITGKKITLTKSRLNLINRRISEGHDLNKFKQVIEIKYKEWVNDEKMKQYITPETLFAESNFIKYIEQCHKFKPLSTRREGSLSNGIIT